MNTTEAWSAVDYGTECISKGLAVYAGSSGFDRLCRIKDMLVMGNGQLIFAIEYGTGNHILFETVNFEIFTATP